MGFGQRDSITEVLIAQIVDMFTIALDKPAPVTIVMITGDRDFAYAAAILKQRGREWRTSMF